MKEILLMILCVFLLAALLTGCSSTPPPPEPKPMIPALIAGMNIPPDDVENVRYGEAVKQYRSGRYIDPNNTRIMYERNVVYKIEEDATWNLRPNAEAAFKPLPWSPDKRPRILDAQKPIIAEMDTQFKELKRSTEKASKAVDTARMANAISAETRATVQSQSASMAVTVRTIATINENVLELNRKIKELEARTREFEEARRALDTSKQSGASLKPFNPDSPMPDEKITIKSQMPKPKKEGQ